MSKTYACSVTYFQGKDNTSHLNNWRVGLYLCHLFKEVNGRREKLIGTVATTLYVNLAISTSIFSKYYINGEGSKA